MQIKKIRVNGRDNIVRLAAIIGLGVFVAQMLEIHSLVSALFACSFICVAVNYVAFITARKKIRLDDVALFLLTLASLALSQWELNFSYYKPAIIAVCCTLCIEQCAEVTASEKTCRQIQALLIAACIAANVVYGSDMQQNISYIDLNFSNPNEAAMWLVFLIVLLVDSASVSKGVVRKVVALLCGFSLLPMLIGTESRNCLLAIVFFGVGKLLLALFKIRKLPRWTLFLISTAPIAVYFLYMDVFIPNDDYFGNWFTFLVSEGKPLTSRSRIWADLEMTQVKHILFGNYSRYQVGNMHNAMVTIYCSFGLFYAAVIWRKLYSSLKKLPGAGMQLALGTVWLTGCFEASIFAGVAGMYMLVLLLPVFHLSALETA